MKESSSLAMTSATCATSVTSLPTAMNDNQGDRESRKEVVVDPCSLRSHAGLSALLNAVTLHISKSDDDQKTPDSDQQSNCKVDETDSDECSRREKLTTATTPTIVPELHTSEKNGFPWTLMTLLLDPENGDIITFLPDGKYFALRRDEFASKLMKEVFDLDEFDAFLEELSSWGFTTIETKRPGIEVYRHPLFRNGDWALCEQMKQVEPGTEHTEASYGSGFESRSSSISEDDLVRHERHSSEGNKRRLSPSSASTINNGSSSKFCVRAHSSDEESSVAADPRPQEDRDLRTAALAITTQKLNIRESDDREFPLVQQAVVGATHTIVTAAIECLLRDKDHTKQTFEKHAEELSKSTLPGLVPITKELFSAAEDASLSHGNKNDNVKEVDDNMGTEESNGKEVDAPVAHPNS
jgi:HSF-type DNA-binding